MPTESATATRPPAPTAGPASDAPAAPAPPRAAWTFTVDLEDHRPGPQAELRFPTQMRRLLAFCDALGVRATVFVVGEVARSQPGLVRDVAAAGHELGLHGWTHTPLTELDPAALLEQARRGRERLEDLTGTPVRGFRAPVFSLVPASRWATDTLAEAGFTYSSSVVAADNPLFGWPGAPTTPFRWPSGLVEVPNPLVGAGRASVPLFGGTYLRLAPWPVVDRARRWADPGPLPWVYVHPYDIDPGERYWVVPEAGRWGSPLLWVGRSGVLAKVARLLDGGAAAGPPMGERIRSLAGLRTFDG